MAVMMGMVVSGRGFANGNLRGGLERGKISPLDRLLLFFGRLMNDESGWVPLSRRAFLKSGALWLAAGAISGPAALHAMETEKPALRIGLITDLHNADKAPAINRFYREARTKLRESVDHFNRTEVDFVIELGDIIDAADRLEDELGYLQAIEAEYARAKAERHYVLGNHCVWLLTKEQFLEHTAAKQTYYSFDRGGFHFVVLDACFRRDGVPYGEKNFEWTDTDIPPEEREWLRKDLRATHQPVIVFAHQRIDVENQYAIKSAPEVRRILESSGRVRAVFQGHSHRNDHREINGIHYCTVAAMVEGSGAENNAYSVLSAFADGALRLEGFRKQASYSWKA
jgi:predicted phosphodiesterase